MTGALPWAGLLFVAGFATREVAAYHDTSLGAYIASIVLLFIAPYVCPPLLACHDHLTR